MCRQKCVLSLDDTNPRSEDPPGSSSLHVSVPQTNDLPLQLVKEEGFGFVDVHCTFAK